MKKCSILLLVAIAGCGGGSDVDLTPVLGTWRAATIGKDGVGEVQCPGQLFGPGSVSISECPGDLLVTLRENGTASASQGGVTAHGTYTFTGNSLTVTVPGASLSGAVTFQGNRMTVRPTGDPSTAGQYVIFEEQ